MRHRGCGDYDCFAVDAGLGGDEVVILSGNFKNVDNLIGGLAVGGKALRVIEPDAEGSAAVGLQLRHGLAKERRGVRDVFAVHHVAGGEGETVADGLLVGRMDVVG